MTPRFPIGLLAAHDGDVYPRRPVPRWAQTATVPGLVQATAKMMQERLGITILPAQPHSIDVGASELVLKARARPPVSSSWLLAPVPQPRLDGTATASVLTVNRLSDYAYLHHQLQVCHSLVIIGSSVPACELPTTWPAMASPSRWSTRRPTACLAIRIPRRRTQRS